MPQILQNHYVLAVHDIRSSAAFFVDNLGFQVAAEPPGWVFVKRDNCMVMLGECRDALPASELGDHSYFGYLRVDDATRYHDELVGKSVEVMSPLSDKAWGMREFQSAFFDLTKASIFSVFDRGCCALTLDTTNDKIAKKAAANNFIIIFSAHCPVAAAV